MIKATQCFIDFEFSDFLPDVETLTVSQNGPRLSLSGQDEIYIYINPAVLCQ